MNIKLKDLSNRVSHQSHFYINYWWRHHIDTGEVTKKNNLGEPAFENRSTIEKRRGIK